MGRHAVIVLLVAILAASVLAEDPPRPKYKERTSSEWAKDLTSEDVAVRRKAVYALWTLAMQERSLGPILARAIRDEDEYVRQTAAAAIPRLGPQASAAVPGLVDALSDDSPVIRREAMLLLYRIRFLAKPALAPIVKALEDEDPIIRANAAGILEFQGPSAKEVASAALARHLTDKDKKVRLWSARALAIVDPPALVKPALARAKDGTAEERAEAFGQLGYARIAAKEAVPMLVAALDDENAAVREAAVKALGVIDPMGTVDAVAGCLTDEDAKVRRASAEALGYAGTAMKEKGDAIAMLLDDEDVEVRRAAILALSGLLGDAPADAVIAALGDEDQTVQQTALSCLAGLGPKAIPALPQLRKLLASETMITRVTAARALGGIGEPAAVAAPELVALLTDPEQDGSTRAAAARALGTLGRGSPEAINAVVRAIDDPVANVRYAAIDAVGALGPEAVAARGPLVKMLSSDPGLAYMAAQALGKLGESARPALPALRKLMGNEKNSARTSAALAVWQIDKENAEDALAVFRVAFADPALRNAALFLAQREEALIRKLVPDLLAGIEKEPLFVVFSGSAVVSYGTDEDRDRVIALLVKIIEDPPEQVFVIANAMNQLGAIGPPAKAAIPALEKYLEQEKNPTYGPTAQWALDRIREKKQGE